MIPFADPSIPGLAPALDVAAMLELFRRALPGPGGTIELTGGRVLEVRYLPASHCVLLYELHLQDRGDGSASSQLLLARPLRADERPSAPRFHSRTRHAGSRANLMGTSTAYLPQVHMTVHPFPLDPVLPWLSDVLDAPVMQRSFKSMWAPQRIRIRRVVPRLLRYVPEARATLAYEVVTQNANTGSSHQQRLVGKLHRHKQASVRFANALALGRVAADRVGLARPVGYVSRLHLTVEEQVPGVGLGTFASSPSFGRLIREAAGGLSVLRDLPVPLTGHRGPGFEVRVLRRWVVLLTAIRPDLARRIEKVSDRLAAAVELHTQVTGPVHGDLDHSNVLTDGEKLTFIDLDFVAQGDSLRDVGKLLASLRIPALDAFAALDGLAAFQEVFRDEYLARIRGDCNDEYRVRLFESSALLGVAGWCFRVQRPHWADEVAMLVDEAERVLQSAERRPATAHSSSSTRAVPRSFEDRLRWATDDLYMKAVLEPFVQAEYGAELKACRPRIGSGDPTHSRVRYRLSGRRNEERWSASLEGLLWHGPARRGLRRHLAELCRALRGRGDAPQLPRPIAHIPPLSMLVVEVPSGGTRFSRLVFSDDSERRDGSCAVEDVAKALATLHRARIKLRRSVADTEFLAVSRCMGKLRSVRPALAGQLASLADEAERRCHSVPPSLVPTVRPLNPKDILCQKHGVAFPTVTQVVSSHPLLDAGGLLTRLTLGGLRQDKVAAAVEASERFRNAYAEASGASREELAAFEAATSLRLACALAQRDPADGAAEYLLEHAAALLAHA